MIAYIEYDPSGNDRHGEYVLLRNRASVPLNLTGWTLSDGNGRHTFIFPTFTLAPGAEVKLWTRTGTNDASNLFWGSRRAIWNNNGDTATLKNAGGAIVARYSYQGKNKQ